NYADQVLVNQLDNLEKKFPIINKSPEEIAKEAREKYSTTVQPLVQPTVDSISNATQRGIETVTNVKQYGVDKVTAVKDYGVLKANEFMDTKYGQAVSTSVSKTLNVADQYVDYYLPAEEGEEKEEATEDDPMGTRVRKFSGKLRRRVTRVTVQQLEQIQKTTQENLSHLNIVLDLLQNAKTNLNSTNQAVKDRLAAAQVKALALWEELNKEEPQTAEGDEQTPKTLEQRSLAVARHLTKRLVNLYTTASSTLHLPATLQPKFAQAQQYATDLYGQVTKISSVEDASNLVLNQVRETGKTIQETVNNLREQAATNIEWLGKNNSAEGVEESSDSQSSMPSDQ
uniref:Perilipin n=1 Tax=Strigamia maritima TaxID=126957 RepID=T1JL68_STRMM